MTNATEWERKRDEFAAWLGVSPDRLLFAVIDDPAYDEPVHVSMQLATS